MIIPAFQTLKCLFPAHVAEMPTNGLLSCNLKYSLHFLITGKQIRTNSEWRSASYTTLYLKRLRLYTVFLLQPGLAYKKDDS